MSPEFQIVARGLVLFAFCIWMVECCRWSKLRGRLKYMSDSSQRSVRIFRLSRASDHWKQAAMMHLSARLMRASLLLGVVWLVTILPLLIWWGAGDPLGVLQWAVTWPGLSGATVMAGLYAWIRSRYAR